MSLLKLNVYLVFVGLFLLSVGAATSVSLLSLATLILSVPAMYFFMSDKERWKTPRRSQWLLLVFFLWISLSLVFNSESLLDFLQSIWKVKYLLFAFFSVYAFQFSVRQFSGKKWIWWVLNGFLLSIVVASFSGIYGLWSGVTPLRFEAVCHPVRLCGLFSSYHSFAYIMMICSLLLIGMCRDWERLRHVCSIGFLFITTFVAVIALVMSLTKGAWIGFFMGLSFFYFKENHKKTVYVFALLTVILGAAFVSIPKIREAFTQRTITNEQRFSLLESAWYGFKEDPFLGAGYGQFSERIPDIKEKNDLNYPLVNGQVPSDYLEILASTGLIGLFIYLSFLGSWLREMFLRDDLMARMSFPLIIGVMTAGIFHFTIGDRAYFPFLMAIYALSQIVVPKVKL